MVNRKFPGRFTHQTQGSYLLTIGVGLSASAMGRSRARLAAITATPIERARRALLRVNSGRGRAGDSIVSNDGLIRSPLARARHTLEAEAPRAAEPRYLDAATDDDKVVRRLHPVECR